MSQSNQITQYDNSLYSHIPLYSGNQIFKGNIDRQIELPGYVIGLISLVMLFTIFIAIPGIYDIQRLIPITFYSMLIGVSLSYRINNETIKAEIDFEGITKMYASRKKKLSWENIDYIKVITRYNASRFTVIYFKNKVNGENKESPKTHKIVIPYSPKAAHCIMKYWKKEIQDLDAMKSWQKYLERLQEI